MSEKVSDSIVAVRGWRRRVWSAPPATLQHIRRGGRINPHIAEASKALANPRIAHHAISVLFPLGYAPPGTVPQKAIETEVTSTPSPSSSSSKEAEATASEAVAADNSNETTLSTPLSPSYDSLRAQLEAATSQIHLLNAANEQTLRTYSMLESEHRQLTEAHDELVYNYEKAMDNLTKSERLRKEQEQLIGRLQRKVDHFEMMEGGHSSM